MRVFTRYKQQNKTRTAFVNILIFFENVLNTRQSYSERKEKVRQYNLQWTRVPLLFKDEHQVHKLK